MIAHVDSVSRRDALVRLVPATADDAERTHRAIAPESAMNLSFFADPVPFSLERQRSFLERMARSDTDMLFVTERVEDGAAVGCVGLHEYDRTNRNARLGVLVFNPRDRGRGYNATATELLFIYAFDTLALHKIYVRVLKSNEKALAKYRGMRFVVESVFREEYLLNGTFHDMIGLSLLDREWRKNAPHRTTAAFV